MAKEKTERESPYLNYFQQLFDSWEKSMSMAVETWFKSPTFDKTSEESSEVAGKLQSYMYDIMDKTLQNRFIPLKRDVEKVFESLETIESRLEDLTVVIDDIEKHIKERPAKEKTATEKPAKKTQKTKTSRRQKK